jgi:hypothetical protein
MSETKTRKRRQAKKARPAGQVAMAGERVMDSATGKVICHVRNNIIPGSPLHSGDFHEFAPGEYPWVNGQRVDRRCVRPTEDLRGWQIFVEGEWRP